MREHLAFVEPEERLLVGADLVHVDVVEAGVGELFDLVYVGVGLGAADDALADVPLAHQLGDGFEVRGDAQLRQEPRRDCGRRLHCAWAIRRASASSPATQTSSCL